VDLEIFTGKFHRNMDIGNIKRNDIPFLLAQQFLCNNEKDYLKVRPG
jgi:hypothetical protein